MMRAGILSALTLALAACGGQRDTPTDETQPGDTMPTGKSLVQARMIVDANGFSGRDGAPIRFGTAREEVDAKASEIFPDGPIKSEQDECGAGPMEFSKYGPVDLAFLDGRFAGWFLRPGKDVATSDGIAPGLTTLDALKSERQVQELDTTLDGEFQYTTADYGTITGFADPDGSISSLSAGITCFFR